MSEVQEAFMPFRLMASVWMKCGELIRSVDGLFDTLGEELHDLDIRFPEIVVVGTESVGKSSLLEKIAGMAIFPRGDGITTRFPFRLRLHHCTKADMQQRTSTVPEDQIYKMYGHPVLIKFDGDTSYLSHPHLVRARVQEQNKKVQTSNLGFDERELVLNMYSDLFPSLTLLDLPGLLAAKGPNDPEFIVERGRSIVAKRIENEDAIVLAVLNARSNIRGTAAGIHLIQQKKAEHRTLVVLTCVDRTDKDDKIPAIMRQLPELGLPKLGHHYHAVIGRDLQRTASIQRANPSDCEKFVKAVAELNSAEIQEYLDQDLISEESLDKAMDIITLRARSDESEHVKQIAQSISDSLDKTREAQERFEERYFQPMTGSEPSDWQKHMNVDPALLAPDLLDFLGSKKLAERLSDMLARHIGLKWAPRMEVKVKESSEKCEILKAECGLEPPSSDQHAAVIGYTRSLVECFLQLLGQHVSILTNSVAADCKAQITKDSTITAVGRQADFSNLGTTVTIHLNWQFAKASANSFILKFGATILDVVKKCLNDNETDSRLHRFPVFCSWVSAVAQQTLHEQLGAAQGMLENLFAALMPETYLPSQHPTREALHTELCQTVIAVLPRIIHQRLLRGFAESMRNALSSAELPCEHGGRWLLEEDLAHAAKREKLVAQLQALRLFTAELGVLTSEVRRAEFAAEVEALKLTSG